MAKLLPPVMVRRVIYGIWTSGTSDALTQEDIDAAICLPGPSDPEFGPAYIGALDIGLTHDAASFIALAKRGTACKVARVWNWQPTAGNKVSIDEIEKTILQAHAAYRFRKIGADPWQAAQLVERCKARGVPIAERTQSGKNLMEQASALIDAFTSKSLSLFDYPPLTYDLRHARIEERSYGFRLVSSRGPNGHGDRMTALSIALAEAKPIIAPAVMSAMAGGLMAGGVNGHGHYYPRTQHRTNYPHGGNTVPIK